LFFRSVFLGADPLSSNKAGVLGITVNSNKSIVGQGTAGVIKGRGLRIVSGAKNVIIQ
jgi:pectin lyase